MIPRSPSRRRRASRSGGSSPQPVRSPRHLPSPSVSPGRRASIAVSPVDSERIQRHMLAPEIMNRGARHSIIPDISLDTRSDSSSEDIEMPIARAHSARNSLVPDTQGSRSPRHSLVPGDYSRSPRGSIVPDTALSPRNSLVPDSSGSYNRSPRNSLVPEVSRSPRHSLVPDQTTANRSRRNSQVPDGHTRLTLDLNRSPRNSLLPDGTAGTRNIRINDKDWESASPDEMQVMNINRSPRHSIAPDINRSPRGSITVERDRDREYERISPRGSIGEYSECPSQSPRNSIGGDSRNYREPLSAKRGNDRNERSARGSLTFSFQDTPQHGSRRYSSDYGQIAKASSPYKPSRGNLNQGYNQSQTTYNEGGSRRASSSVSQVSGDEQKRLFSEKRYTDPEESAGIGLTTTYGSVAYQLKDANLEANSTCDFIIMALKIFNKTVVVTVILVCLSALPLLMLIMGAQFVSECPREPNIPIYMIVGGTIGCIKMVWIIWNQLHTYRLSPPVSNNNTMSGSQMLSYILTFFLLAWFILGNYWILRVKWPDYNPTLFEPNRYCHRTLFLFAVVHLFIIYTLIGFVLLLVIILAGCQVFGSPWLNPVAAFQ